MAPSPDTKAVSQVAPRIGVDLGGTKIAGIVLDANGRPLTETRIPAPRDDYRATLEAIRFLVDELDRAAVGKLPVGIGIPGSISPVTGRVQGANSTWLNGQPLAEDLGHVLERPVRLANDANCFALSEAADGAGAKARSVFGVIVGTGCGGGLVFKGDAIEGLNAIGGEWGHTPLPWPRPDEVPAPACWCGKAGCIELWVSGTGLSADHERCTGLKLTAKAIVELRNDGDSQASATLARHADRLARGLAVVVNIFDPDVIVLGGGLSNVASLYDVIPELLTPWVFAAAPRARVVPPRWGDASGVRGAARLWP